MAASLRYLCGLGWIRTMTLDTQQQKTLADLTIQAMLFDMGIDLETASLTPKVKDPTPIWIRKWRDKEAGGDRQPNDYEGGKDERN